MKIKTIEIAGLYSAITGMRNPMNSWAKSDSHFNEDGEFIIGANDLKLAQRLILAGTEHGKFMRQIYISFDITAPLYWWSEFDTYHYNTKNSCSTMHKLMSRHVELSDFEDFENKEELLKPVIIELNKLVDEHNKPGLTQEKLSQCTRLHSKNEILIQAKSILPCSYLQKRTVSSNYQEIRNMYFQRRNHRLPLWRVDFCDWVATLPYSKELIMLEK